ncbi:MAG TPA: pilus assembly protein PilM [Candidatus Pacearchaeota archaeon]|nr:pilus assembly protein PilM [Candidatus Pacearchaeota archaeon]
MSIEETIKKARKRGAGDDLILKKIIELNPEKKDLLEQALKRGATPTQVINEIIKQSKKTEKDTTTEGWKFQLAKIKQSQIVSEFLDVTRQPIVGIDVSDHSIEVMQLNKQGKIVSYGRAILESGIVENGNILKQKELIDILNDTLKKTKPFPLIAEDIKELKAIISLPENKTYIHHFQVSVKDNLYNSIVKQIETNIPLPIKKLSWDFFKIYNKKREDQVDIICVAVDQDVIDSYIYFLRAAEITPVAIDVESFAIGRGLLKKIYDPVAEEVNNKKKKKKTESTKEEIEDTMILDIGAKDTIISVYDYSGAICFAISLPIAGFSFTAKIAEHLGITMEKAEELKVSGGFSSKTDFFFAIEREALKIVNEVKEANSFYKKRFNRDVKKIILAGGSALLPEIDVFFQKFFGNKVEIGNPLTKIKDLSNLDEKKAVIYSNVIGLALRGISDDPVRDGINLLPSEVKAKEIKIQQSKQKSVLLASVVVALSGLVLLGLSLFYLVYLPVPAPMVPLKQRVITTFYLEKDNQELTVKIRDEFVESGISIYALPGERSEVIYTATTADEIELLQKIDIWYKVKIGSIEGWASEEYLEVINMNEEVVPKEEIIIE